MISQIATVLQLIISLATVITLVYTFLKFTGTPNKTQNERIDELEKWRKTVEERLNTGDDHFRRVDEGNKITQKALLALMKHAINGNDIEDLKKAEKNLEEYLVDK